MSSRDTEVVQQFNAELSSLYEVRPPISKAKMSQITRVSMKAIKMYKHIVQSVERFIIKCRPEYKIPGLYVIDSIVRQSRHQFGIDKDVYAGRFARNFKQTFQNLFLTCPPDDKPKIVRVLNLWQRNNVFSAETIQPLLDMANPNASLSQMKFESSPQPNTNSRDVGRESRDTNPALKDPNLILQLQQLANSLGLTKTGNTSSDSQQESQNQIKFNKKLLDFDYGDEEDDEERGETPTEAEPPLRSGAVDDNNVTNPLALSMAQNLLSNPELLQQLQQMQKTIQQTELLKLSISELEAHGLTNLGQQSVSGQQLLNAFQAQQQQNQTLINSESNNNCDENRKQNNELIVNFENLEQKLNTNNDCKLNPNLNSNDNSFQYLQNANNFGPQLRANNDLNYALNNSIIDPNNQYHQQQSQQFHQQFPQSSQEINERSGSQSPRSTRSPRRSRFGRYRDRSERSRSRSPRSRRDRDSRRGYRSRSRSPRNSRFNDRLRSPQSYERERERERRRKGLPPIRKGCLTICSTTLWLGHVPKLVSEADLSDAFGEFGAITSIDLIPSRGCAYVCMNRRQDAAKALNNLRNHKLHGSLIKMAWAPGKGMKGKEFKDYWEVDEGSSYIPYSKLPEEVDLDLLEEGGTVDEDTVPEKLQEMRKRKNKEREDQERETAAMMARAAAMMPMVGTSFGVTGLVMTPSMINITTQPSVLSIQSNEPSMLSTVTTNSFPQMSSHSLIMSTNESVNSMKSDITEVTMNTENSQSDIKIDSKPLASNTSGPLFPPPMPPPFQPLSMPPMPPMLGSQRMPWLSGPPPPIIGANRMPSPQRPPLLPLSSAPNLTSDTVITSIRPDNMPGVGPPLVKPEDRPPLIATLPHLALPHEDLPPRLHPGPNDRPMDRNFVPRDRFRPDMERPELDTRSHPNEDPFAPSMYELRAMERNQMMRPPIPHQMGGSGRSALLQMPHNMNERFPFEPQRHQRPYHPRHHGMRPDIRPDMRPDIRPDMRPDIRPDMRPDIRPDMRPDIRHHHNYDRHSNHQNRGSGRDQFPNRGFGRRDRPSRWKSEERHDSNRHFNRNNNNSDYNSGFNKRQDRDQESDEPFIDSNVDNSFDDNICVNNEIVENIDWSSEMEKIDNKLDNNSTNEPNFEELNRVSIKSEFQTNTEINTELNVENENNINENISESVDNCVKSEPNVENT